MVLRFPLAQLGAFINGWIFEVQDSYMITYRARFKEVMHRGFANAYNAVYTCQCDSLGNFHYWNVQPSVPIGS